MLKCGTAFFGGGFDSVEGSYAVCCFMMDSAIENAKLKPGKQSWLRKLVSSASIDGWSRGCIGGFGVMIHKPFHDWEGLFKKEREKAVWNHCSEE